MAIGDLIKDLRVPRGWSQARLADAVNDSQGTSISRENVSRSEHGRVTPGPFYLRGIAAALDVPLAVFEDDDLRRRTFLTDVAATAIAPIVTSDLLSEGFSARLDGGPTVDEWEDKLASYGSAYMSAGAADIQRMVSRELLIIQQQLDSPRMWTLAARLMTLFAKTFPGSDGVKAVSWYRMAARAADESGDVDTRVWVRGRAAIALGYEGAAPAVADAFADQALAIDARPSIGRLNAVFGKAHAAALRGDTSTARQLVDNGRRVFDAAGSSEQASDYAVPWWRLNVFISLLAARLGDERTAVAAQEAARGELPAQLPRFATHLDMHEGLMLARSGDTTTGVTHARSALDALPPEKHSLTLRMLMKEVEADSPSGAAR